MKVLGGCVLGLCLLVLGTAGRPDKLQGDSVEEEVRRPYSFKYTASRYHHGRPDREHEEVRGADGVTRGVYRYIDPRQRVQEVIYTADKNGFNVKNSGVPENIQETNAVLTARTNHEQLFAKIQAQHAKIQAEQEATVGTEENQQIYEEVPFDFSVLPQRTEAVSQRAAYHQYLFEKTQAEHARIAAERGPYDPLIEEEERVYADVPFDYSVLPKSTSAVASRTALHAKLFEQTQAEHARIAAERGPYVEEQQ